jgi:hypothetical protein
MCLHMNLHEFMRSYEAKIKLNASNSFKPQLSMHLVEVLGKVSVVKSLY